MKLPPVKIGPRLVEVRALVPEHIADEMEEAAERRKRTTPRFVGEVIESAWKIKKPKPE